MKNRITKFRNALIAGLFGLFGLTGAAHAVNINPDGLGQVLLYPYYTVNGDNVTLISVVNTAENAKAVKVRFLEGQNSREVLDFNLYLSAFDTWVAAVIDDNGTPTLVVNDTSCTAPYLYLNDSDGNGTRDGYQEFLPYALTDGGENDISRTREGHFEMIEMAVIVDDSATAVTHINGFPADCQQIQDAWTIFGNGNNGYWVDDPTIDALPPSTGLFGGAAIINVEKGTMYSYVATAINGWANTLESSDGDYLHSIPGNTFPSLSSGNVFEGSVFLDNGDLLVSETFDRGVDAVSFVLMRNSILNEYTVEDAVAASTEWVVTFPTKNFYVDPTRNGGEYINSVAPFTSLWDLEFGGGACEIVLLDNIWDREEGTITPNSGGDIPPVVSPPLPVQPEPIIPFELCYETNVIQFGSDDFGSRTNVFGSSNFHNFDVESLGFESGWAKLQLDNYGHDANGNGVIDGEEVALSRDSLGGLEGLPVIGFSIQEFKNNFTGENNLINSTYSGLFNHKYTRQNSD